MLAAAVLAGSIPGQASAAHDRELRAEDVTDTAAGRAAIRRAIERMRERYGIEAAVDELTVWAIGDRRIVGPRGSAIAVREVTRPNGSVARYVEATEAAGEGAPGNVEIVRLDELQAAGLELGWQLVGDHCWIDDADRDFSWMDVCYHKYQATKDGSAAHDYYALQMFTTFAVPWYLGEIGDPWIEARPDPKGAAHTWFDWSPRADSTRNCENPQLSVSVNGFGLSLPALQCETWDITKYAAAGKFRNQWREGLCQFQHEERELAFEVVSKVGQGKVPRWVFPWHEDVQVASCLT
jgi:hypothetical protein